jgi:hypothetical protein
MSATIRSGLVGFFDILNYQNLLEKNEPETVAKDVLPVLQGIKTSVRAEAETFLKLPTFPTEAKITEPIMDSMKWVIFSDTVLITLPFDGKDSSRHLYYWLVFLQQRESSRQNYLMRDCQFAEQLTTESSWSNTIVSLDAVL